MRLSLRIITVVMLIASSALGVAAQQWALPKVSVAILRGEPRHGAEQVSQVVMGTPLKITSRRGDWWKVETPEGYSGFVRKNTLHGMTENGMKQWRESRRGVLLSDRTEFALAGPDPAADRVSDLVSGAILQITGDETDGYTAVRLPDGREGYVESQLLADIEEWANLEFDPSLLPADAGRLMGTPYVWGGTSCKGMDCSGLTQICAYRQGVMLPRDASQQVKVGTPVDTSDYTAFQPGDLLFFGNTATGRINHVALSTGGAGYIHCSARVRISSLDPSSPDYENPGLIAVRRLDPSTALRLSLRNSPLYF